MTETTGGVAIEVACSAQWNIEVDAGIRVEQLKLDASVEGAILYATGEQGVTLETTRTSHVARLRSSPGRPGEWVMRIAPTIAVAADGANRRISLRVGSADENIVSFELDEPRETAFLATPVPPKLPIAEFGATSSATLIPPGTEATAKKAAAK